MIKSVLFAIVIILFASDSVFSKQETKNFEESNNLLRGIEAVENYQLEEAIEYFDKEIEENPENGYAHYWIAYIRAYDDNLGMALTSVNLAIKHLPKKDKIYKGRAYKIRAEIYQSLEKYDKAIDDYTEAIKYTPEDMELYKARADIYIEQEKYDLSEADFKKMISLDEGSVSGYIGLGCNYVFLEEYDKAIFCCDYVLKLDSDYALGYYLRAYCNVLSHRYHDAIEDIVKSLELKYDDNTLHLLPAVAAEAFPEVEARIKLQCNKEPNDGYWPYILGFVYETQKYYKKAIEQYEISLMYGENFSNTTYSIACCYSELGDYETALKNIDVLVETDPVDIYNKIKRADLLYELGRTSEAIDQLDKCLEIESIGYVYYRRGFYKDNTADYDGAIEDYTTAIVLDPTYPYPYLGRGDMYRVKGEKKLSMADYKKVIELDTVPTNESCAQYAFIELGETDKAIDFMNRMIESDKNNAGNYYDAACVYARIGQLDTSIEMLKKSFELGFRRFKHIENDDDLHAIRYLPEFNELIKTYKERHLREIEIENDNDFVEKVIEIPFTNKNNICQVKCTINNLPLHFVFDTGASDVSISSVEAAFMLKNGYLSQQDFQGKQDYITADGDISEGTIINLRNVEFGGLQLTNIKASVVKNQTAPLLLGQSVLKKLGIIEINNDRDILKVTYKEPK